MAITKTETKTVFSGFLRKQQQKQHSHCFHSMKISILRKLSKCFSLIQVELQYQTCMLTWRLDFQTKSCFTGKNTKYLEQIQSSHKPKRNVGFSMKRLFKTAALGFCCSYRTISYINNCDIIKRQKCRNFGLLGTETWWLVISTINEKKRKSFARGNNRQSTESENLQQNCENRSLT